MSRLPFDPAKMAPAKKGRGSAGGAAGGAEGAGERPLRVSELCTLIDQALRLGVRTPVRVIGEVSNFRDRTHWWFALKDESSVVDCVMFAAAARKAGFPMANGQQVVATGRVEHYAAQGRTQLYVERIEPVGAGALDLKFKALCEELRSKGYFDPARKQALPWFPRRVAVVTSRSGAALQDVLDTMRRRCPAVGVALIDVRVQGVGAADEIAAALRWLSTEHERLGIDAVILTRGGGSTEDLWCFNERAVADAVLACAVPIVAAIGHETDTTIAELVADERAATPTQAAMRLTPDRAGLLQQVATSERRLASLAKSAVQRARERLRAADPGASLESRLHRARLRVERSATRLARLRPEAVYAARRAHVEDASRRLAAAMRVRLAAFDAPDTRARLDRAWRLSAGARAQRLAGLARALELSGPTNVLRRGYSMTFRADGALVRDPSDVRHGETILTRVLAGQIRSVVEAPGQRDAPNLGERPGATAPRARSRPRPAGPSEMDLFPGAG